MSDKLKSFVKDHRKELDVFEPSQEVWQKINFEIQKPTFIKSKFPWLKYFVFSASVIAAITLYFIISFHGSNNYNNKAGEQTAWKEEKEKTQNLTTNKFSVKSNKQPSNRINILKEKNNILPPATFQSQESTAIQVENESNSFRFRAPHKKQEYNRTWHQENGSLKVDTTFSGIKKLEINGCCFDVNINSSSRGQVLLKADANTRTRGLVLGKQKYKIKCEIRDSVLIILAENESNTHMIIAGSIKQDAILNFEVPSTISIVVNNSNGNINIRGLQGKTCDIQTKSGDVDVENMNTDLKLKLGSGNLSATNIKGNISAEISSGDFSITGLEGNIDMEMSYGNSKYKNITGNIKTKSTSGDIKIANMDGNAEITSNYGSILLESYKGNLIMDVKSGDITGKNVELTDSMSAKANYGNIKINLINNIDDLSFDLKSNYGTISIDKNGQKLEKENRLVLKRGKVFVKVITDLGNQLYK